MSLPRGEAVTVPIAMPNPLLSWRQAQHADPHEVVHKRMATVAECTFAAGCSYPWVPSPRLCCVGLSQQREAQIAGNNHAHNSLGGFRTVRLLFRS